MRRLLLVTAAAVLAAGCGGNSQAPDPPAIAAAQTPAFEPQETTAGSDDPRLRPAGRYTIAALNRRTALRAQPGGRAITHLRRRTEFGSPMILPVVRAKGGWLQVQAAALPNGHNGWIARDAATLSGTDYDIRVDRAAHEAEFRRDHKVLFRFPVAVGRPGNETPLGRFAVTDKLRTTDASSPYGCCALALNGHQTRLEPGWPGGDRLAIHGTPATWSIGQAVSLGCMRAPATALHKLLHRMPVGAPVFIERS